MTKDYYRTLGLASGASYEEIKLAYRNLVKIYHPDTANSDETHAMMVEINEAYYNLADIDRRSIYDKVYNAEIFGQNQRDFSAHGRFESEVNSKGREIGSSWTVKSIFRRLDTWFVSRLTKADDAIELFCAYIPVYILILVLGFLLYMFLDFNKYVY